MERAVIDEQDDDQGVLDHVKNAWKHAEAIFRTYLSHLSGGAERTVGRVIRRAVCEAIVLVLGATGIVLLTWGVVKYLESLLSVPGAGHMIVGGGLLVVVALIFFVRSLGGKE